LETVHKQDPTQAAQNAHLAQRKSSTPHQQTNPSRGQQNLMGPSQRPNELTTSSAPPAPRPSVLTRPIYGAPLPRPQLNGPPGRYFPPQFRGPNGPTPSGIQMRPRPQQLPPPLLLSSRLLPVPPPRPPQIPLPIAHPTPSPPSSSS
jgi:hypothetical protein